MSDHFKINMKNYLKKEIALLCRSKRIRQTLLFVLYFVFVIYIQLNIYTIDRLGADQYDKVLSFIFRIILPPMLIVLPGNILSQYFFGIEANFIDKTKTIPITFDFILKRKYYLYCFMSFVMFLLLIPAAFFQLLEIQTLVSSFLFAVGPLLFLSFLGSIFNGKKYDLTAGFFLNWKGNDATQYIVTFISGLSVYAILFCLAYFFSEQAVLLFMAVSGIIFIVFSKVWISHLAKYYDAHILDKIEKL